MKTPTKVRAKVLDGLNAVRESGLTNMLDRPTVADIADQLGFEETAAWVEDPKNRKAYAHGIFNGFEVEG